MKKKRTYQMVKVQTVRVAELLPLLATGCIVALDIAKMKMVVALATIAGEVVKLFQFEHPTETEAFLTIVKELREALGADNVKVAMEPTGTYGDAMRHQLLGTGVSVWMVSPKRTHDSQELFDNVHSLHDAKSAVLIAKLQAMGLSMQWQPPTPSRVRLRALVELRQHEQSREEICQGRLEAMLARHWPEFGRWIVRAWYMRRKGYTEGSKQRAVVAVMRKLTRAMFHIAKGNAFDASKLFDVRRLDLDSTKAFAEEARVVAPTTTSATAKETTEETTETESKATSSEETSVAASQVTATTGTMERTASQETTVATAKQTSPTAKQDMSEQTASQETIVATAKQTSPIAKTAKGKKKIVPEKTPAATVSETDVAASKVANTTASSTEASVEAPQPAAAPTSSESNALPRDASD